MNTSNTHNQSAHSVVEGLIRAGVQEVFISPGYRNAPIVAALKQRPQLKLHSVIDERSAGFLALGACRYTRRPSAVVCTSGSAPAHYYPAIVEAHECRLPLVIVSADRPEALVAARANQAMNQVGMFGHFTSASLHFDASIHKDSLDFLNELTKLPSYLASGPVHINLALQKPLEPQAGVQPTQTLPSSTDYRDSIDQPEGLEDLDFLQQLKQFRRPLIVVGEHHTQNSINQANAFLSEHSAELPIVCDILGPGRNSHTSLKRGQIQEILSSYTPDVVIHVGRRTIDTWLETWIPKRHCPYAVISPETREPAPHGHWDYWWQRDEADFWQALKDMPEWIAGWETYLPHRPSTTDQTSGVPSSNKHPVVSWQHAAATISQALPSQCWVFLGNSLTIRAFDDGQYFPKGTQVFGQRGLSGIDGNITQSVGMGVSSGRPGYVILGDVAALHDLGGFLLLREWRTPVTVIILNNGCGGIFHKLPISQHPSIKDPFLSTPHSVDFQTVAQLGHMEYSRCTTPEQVARALSAQPSTRLVEIMVEP